MEPDRPTADAFATSWNNLPVGSVYTEEQVLDWFAPLVPADFAGKRVLEMGCGNGSLMVHAIRWRPEWIEGVDLGASVRSARQNLSLTGATNWTVRQDDLTTFESEGFDIVYSIGVLHHLKKAERGFASVVRNARTGGQFHCWVYAREGNGIVIALVDPIRRIAAHLPWWFTKYGIATPLAIPYFLYARILAALPQWSWLRRLPLYEYSLWIARRDLRFFRHVAFDQLVTPQTAYITRATIERWLRDNPLVDPESTYIIFRNANSWKFGGRRR